MKFTSLKYLHRYTKYKMMLNFLFENSKSPKMFPCLPFLLLETYHCKTNMYVYCSVYRI